MRTRGRIHLLFFILFYTAIFSAGVVLINAAPTKNELTVLAARVIHEYRKIPEEKYVSFHPMAGFGDILKGSSSVFYLALVTGRRYHSYFNTNGAFTPLVSTHMADGVECHPHANMIEISDGDYDDLAAAWERAAPPAEEQCWNAAMNGEAAYFFVHKFNYTMLLDLESEDLFWIYTYIFWQLPSPSLIAQMEYSHIDVAVQMRVTENKLAPERALQCFLKEIRVLCLNVQPCYVFVTSDDTSVTNSMKGILQDLDPNIVPFTSEMTAHHIAFTTSLEEQFVTLYDWWHLTRARNLLISRSGFGETAGWRNKFDVDVFKSLDTHTNLCLWNNCHGRPQKRDGWNYC